MLIHAAGRMASGFKLLNQRSFALLITKNNSSKMQSKGLQYLYL